MPLRAFIISASAISLLLTACSGSEDPLEAAGATAQSGDTPGISMPEPDTLPADMTGGCGAVRAAGYCGVMFGMTEEQAMEAWPGSLTSPGAREPGNNCHYLNPSPDNYDLGFMVVDGIVMRLDVRSGKTATAKGATIGMTAEEVKALYPYAEEQPNKYTNDPDIVMTVESGHKLVFETGPDGAILRYRAGMPPAVDYVEGCS